MSLDLSYWERPPCTCPECRQAGIQDRPQRRDPRSHEWLHGYALKRLYEAQDSFWTLVDEKFNRKRAE